MSQQFLKNAKKNKKDEFYTQLIDIENELKYYENHFDNKIVYCNCDDYQKSNFAKYFISNFSRLKIKKLYCSGYNENGKSFWVEYSGNNQYKLNNFSGNGDFRNDENIRLLIESDIVVTNPPFSLFREFINQIVEYDKKFLIIGNINCITYKNIFNLIKDNKVWLGINMVRGISGFIVPEDYPLYGTETLINSNGEKIVSPNNCLWLTNLDNVIRHEFIPLSKSYYENPEFYPKYDNYDGININKTKDIPYDYSGFMGVPITFLHKFNPEQFEIIQFRKGNDGKDLSINGKYPYFRIIIKKARN